MLALVMMKTANNIISANNAIPLEKIPDELLEFIGMATDGNKIVIGRNLYELMGNDVPFPGRETTVITRRPNYRKQGVKVINYPEHIAFKKNKDIFVLGGVNTFKTFYPYADIMYILDSVMEITGMNLDIEMFPDYFYNNFKRSMNENDTIYCTDGSVISTYYRNMDS